MSIISEIVEERQDEVVKEFLEELKNFRTDGEGEEELLCSIIEAYKNHFNIK